MNSAPALAASLTTPTSTAASLTSNSKTAPKPPPNSSASSIIAASAPRDPEYSLAQLNLARARVLTGDTAGAKTAYQDFFAYWKDADPDIPVLLEAKSEYAKLQ